MGASIGDDTIGAIKSSVLSAISYYAMKRNFDRKVGQTVEQGIWSKRKHARGTAARPHSGVIGSQNTRIFRRQFLDGSSWASGTSDYFIANTAEDARRKPTTPMWNRKKNDPIDSWAHQEKEVVQN